MQITLLLLSGFLFSVLFGMVIIPRILVISHKKRLYDVPDSRKVHTTPVPRLGGLSFFPVILMSMFLVIGFRLYFWDMGSSSLSFNMLYEYLFLSVTSSPSRSCRRYYWYCPVIGSVPWEACSVCTRFPLGWGSPSRSLSWCISRTPLT